MGQQQLLLIILGVIIVGIAIAVGLQLFQSGSIDAAQDGMINEIMNISATADQWRLRPTTMGGGGGSFTADIGNRINENDRLTETSTGDYEVTVTAGGDDNVGSILIVGTSTAGYGTIQLTYVPDGATEADRYTWGGTGEFDHMGAVE